MIERRYRLPTKRLVIARAGIAAMLVGLFVLAFATASDAPWWLWPVQVAIALWVFWMSFIARLEPGETTAGFQTRSQQTLMWQRIPWDEIDRFSELKRNPLTGLRLACIVLTSGRQIPIMAISAGQTVRWYGGESDDIVAELNRRLVAWRDERGHVGGQT